MMNKAGIGLPSHEEKAAWAARQKQQKATWVAQQAQDGRIISVPILKHDPARGKACPCRECDQIRRIGKALISPRPRWEK